MRRIAVVTLTCALALFAGAEEVPMRIVRDAVNVRSFAAAPRLVERAQIAPAIVLAPATEAVPEELEAIQLWNADRRTPTRNGMVRPLGETMSVRFGGAQSSARGISGETANGDSWGTSIRVESAKRLRLHLENVQIPSGATLWVYGRTGEAIAFDASLLDEKKSLWTPSVDGDTLHLEIEAPAGETVSFETREVLELLYARGGKITGDDAPTCLIGQDVNCQNSTEFPALSAVKRAIGQMEFVSGGSGAVCTGTLINNQQSANTPYFLTANHCISGQTAASSLETYFDYTYDSCVSSQAHWLPAVHGATLMTTSSSSDVTLLRLSSMPSNRALLGWTTSALTNGTKLHRISHPVPDGLPREEPQTYSRTILTTTSGTCTGIGRPNYIYSNETSGGEGGVYGGSSGSAAIVSDNANDARIVGQLLGSCGPAPAAGCDRRNNTVDGAFSASYAVLQPFLSPSTQAVCTPDTNTICLMNNRFSVRLQYDIGQGLKPMTAIKYTGDTGLFWFANASNIEVMLKMVDACTFNSRFWVFAGGTTDVGVTMTVTDTKNGTVKTYTNPRGTNFLTITDTGAFATCP